MQQLRAHAGIERRRPLLDQAQPEVHVAEQASLLGRAEDRAAPELARPPDVVHERGREQQVAAQPRVQLRRLAAERRHADRVLEQPARVRVVAVERRRQRAHRARVSVSSTALDRVVQPRMRDLGDEELEEAVELVGVAAHRRRHRGRDRRPAPARACARRAAAGRGTSRRGRARAPRRPRRSACRAARRRSTRAPRCGRSGRRARARGTARRSSSAAAPSSRRRRRPRRCGSPRAAAIAVIEVSLGASWAGTVRAMATIRPFRALRYDEAVAGPLADLVAPPYDVISPEEREEYRHREPAQRRAPDAARLGGGGGARPRELARDRRARPGRRAVRTGGSRRSTSGPTASRARARASSPRCASSRTRTASSCRTSARTPARRRAACACSSATRTQLEPIFLLWDGSIAARRSRRAGPRGRGGRRDRAALAARRRLRRRAHRGARRRQLLIADGHHRYETTRRLPRARGHGGERLDDGRASSRPTRRG